MAGKMGTNLRKLMDGINIIYLYRNLENDIINERKKNGDVKQRINEN